MNGAITIGTRVLVILGYLVGAADSEAMSGETVGRVSLVLVGAVVAAFLFYVARRLVRLESGTRSDTERPREGTHEPATTCAATMRRNSGEDDGIGTPRTITP